MQAITNYFNPFAIPYFRENKPLKPYHSYIFDPISHIPSAICEAFKSRFTTFNQTIKNNDDAINALTFPQYHLLKPALMTFFQELSADQQEDFLRTAVLEGVKQRNNDLVTRCFHLFVERKDRGNLDTHAIIEKYIALFDINDEFQPYDPMLAFFKSELKTLIPQVFHFLMSIFDTLMMSTSLFEVGRAPKSAWDAYYQLDVYYKIISIPLTILWAVNAYFPNPILSGTAFVLSVVSLGLFIYSYKWLKPLPNHLPKTVNLTECAEQGKIPPVSEREVEISMIMGLLIRNLNSSTTKHILLKGISGVGKTTIVEGLALKIASGNVPSELKGAKIFMANAATLLKEDLYGDKTSLEQIRQAIGDHKEKIILVVDEIQSLLQNPALKTNLLSLLDASTESIPLFIGITSSDEYQKNSELFQTNALARRLSEIVEVKEMDEAQTISILRSMLQLRYPEISEMSNELYKKIYDLSQNQKKLPEPSNSNGFLSVLAEGIRCGLQGDHLTAELNQLRQDLLNAKRQQVGRIYFSKLCVLPLDDVLQIEEKIKKKEAEIKAHRETVDSYTSLKKERRDREVFLKKLADKIRQPDSDETSAENLIQQFLFELSYLFPAMEEQLASNDTLKVAITEELIEATFPENPGYRAMSEFKDRQFTGSSKKMAGIFC